MSMPSSYNNNLSFSPNETTMFQVLPKLQVISSMSSHLISKDHQSETYPVKISNTLTSVHDTDSAESVSRKVCYHRKPFRKSRRKSIRYKVGVKMDSPRSVEEKLPEDFKLPKITQRTRTKSAKPSPRQPLTLDPGGGSYYVENEYTTFTSTDKFPRSRFCSKKEGVSIIRSQRLFHLTKQLRKCHNEYNKFQDLEERDLFLTNEILQRYIMALDLALNENYMGIALEIVHKMYDTAKYMIPLFTHIFYHVDGTHTPLPVVVDGRYDFIKSLGPVIYALNRIPFSSSSPDRNCHLRLETHLMKLQLEVLMLVVAPVESAIFRATLEVVPHTAFTAYQRLVSLKLPLTSSSFRWQNDSVMKKEYGELLETFSLADQLGCKGSLVTINSNATKSSRKVNCDSELEMSDGEISDLH